MAAVFDFEAVPYNANLSFNLSVAAVSTNAHCTRVLTFILSPSVEWKNESVQHGLLIRQLVIVTLSGILREVLHELPIVALGIVEVPALAVWMCVGRRGLSVSG